MYPIDVSATNASPRNRVTTFFRYIMAIPMLLFVGVYGYAAFVAVFIAWFALMFTGKYPAGLYNFVAGYVRLNGRSTSYALLLADPYPPFSAGDEPGYAVKIKIGPPQATYSRVLVFFRFLLIIPVLIVAVFYALGLYIGAIISWFAILFTGKQPDGIFTFMTGALTFLTRANGYSLLLTDKFPPI